MARKYTAFEKVAITAWAATGFGALLMLLFLGAALDCPGDKPKKITDIGQLELREMPVTKATRSWFTRAAQTPFRNFTIEYELCTNFDCKTTVLATFESRPYYMTPNAADDNLVFCVGSDLYRIGLSGTPKKLKTSDGKPLDVLATTTNAQGVFLLNRDSLKRTVYFLPFDKDIADKQVGTEDGITSPDTAFVTTSDGCAFVFYDPGAVVRRIYPSTDSFEDASGFPAAIRELVASGDDLHGVTTSGTVYQVTTNIDDTGPITYSAKALVATMLAPAATDLLIGVAGLTADGVFAITQSTAAPRVFDTTSTDLSLFGLACSDTKEWALAATGADAWVWLWSAKFETKSEKLAGSSLRELTTWGDGVAFAADTAVIQRLTGTASEPELGTLADGADIKQL